MKEIYHRFYYYLRSIAYQISKLIATLFSGGTIENGPTILVIRTDKIGDFVIFSRVLTYLKKAYPEHRICLVGDTRLTPLVNKFTEVNIFLPLDVGRFHGSFFYYLSFFISVRKFQFDLAINPVMRSYASDEIIRMTNSKRKIGFRGKERNSLYTDLVNIDDEFMLELRKYKILLEALGIRGISVDDLIPRVVLDKKDLENARSMLVSNGWHGREYVVIHPGSDEEFKNWPINRFALIAEFLSNCGFEIVVTGSANATRLFFEIQKDMDRKFINLTGKTDLIELAAVLKMSTFYFGVDTSAMHLAAAVQTPVIGLVGGGHFSRVYPYGDAGVNRFIYDKNMRCMKDQWRCAEINGLDKVAPCINSITVEMAELEITSLLNYLSRHVRPRPIRIMG